MPDDNFGSAVIARALRDEGVTTMFGVLGAMDLVCEAGEAEGIRHVVTRHEQAAGFAADGFARGAGRQGVAFTSLGPGVANLVSGMYHAKGAGSPVVLLGGGHAPVEDGMGSVQEGSPSALMADICKLSHRVVEPAHLAHWVRRAFRTAVTPTHGPVTLEFPANVLAMRSAPPQLRHLPSGQVPQVSPSGGNPADVEDVVRRIARAKRPVIIAADGVFWSGASDQLREFAETMQVPTCTRRTARGALDERHPLAFTPSLRRGFLEEADLICLIGHPVTALDEWFEPPVWDHGETSWIQVQSVAEHVWLSLPTDATVVGDSRLVLEQMIAVASDLDEPIDTDRGRWVDALVQAKQAHEERRAAALAERRHLAPIHPHVLAHEIAGVLDDSSTLIYDSFTGSNFMTGELTARAAGQVLDAGTFQTLGHSIGMAIGAQMARPGRQVLSLIGDGGFGIAGMDMETMVRYGLPAVVVLYNNASFGGRAWGHDEYYPGRGSGALSQVRYDRMFEPVGCHTEHVTEPDEIRPALERAFESGKPALVDVVGEATETSAVRKRVNLLDTWTRGNFDQLPQEAQDEARSWSRSTFERIAKRSRDQLFGVEVGADELEAMVGKSL